MAAKPTKTPKATKPAKVTKLSEDCARHAPLLREGRVLAIDPSSGSVTSMPGYAIFEAGVLKESGLIKLPAGGELYRRLRALGQSLRGDFLDPIDVLVIENIPPFMSSKGGGFRTKAVVNLHKSVGVVMACIEATACIEVTPQSWHGMLKKLDITSDKTDERDAIALGCCVLYQIGAISDETIRTYCNNPA